MKLRLENLRATNWRSQKSFLANRRVRRWQTILVKNYYLVVEKDYASDSLGYCGKMLLGVYGAPEIYQLYGWIDGKLVEIGQDRGGR